MNPAQLHVPAAEMIASVLAALMKCALVLSIGEVIEDYPDDTPYPSNLILGWIKGRPIHVVAAHNSDEKEIVVITVYEPDPQQWVRGSPRGD